MSPDGELHNRHRIDGREWNIHRLMMSIIAHELEIPFFFRTIHVLHRQILVSVNHKRHQVYFPVNHVVETANFLVSDNISRFQYGIHAVSVDVDRPVADGNIGNPYLPQCILLFVGELCFQVRRRRNIV